LPTSQVTTSLVTMVAVMHHLVGAAEIGKLLGVSRQRVQQIVSRPDFPKPEVDLAMGKVWKTEDVERWIQENRPGWYM
jgi:prophage regulatory protein